MVGDDKMTYDQEVRKVVLAKWPKAEILSIDEFSEGYNNVVYDVVLGTRNLVVKIVKHEHSVATLRKQKRVCDMLCKKFSGFPVPKFLKLDGSGKIIAQPYVISEKIPGVSLSSVYNEIKNKGEVFEQFGELVAKINSIKYDRFGELDGKLQLFDTYDSWYVERCRLMERNLNKLAEMGIVTQRFLDRNWEYYRRTRKHLEKEVGPCLCHGDLSDSNILVVGENGHYEISGLIDLEFARVGGAVKGLFAGNRAHKKKFRYRHRIIQGYNKVGRISKNLDELLFLYNWMSTLQKFRTCDRMKWCSFTEKQAQERRDLIRKKGYRRINYIIDRY